MMPLEMTTRRLEVLEAFDRMEKRLGRPPKMLEVREELGLLHPQGVSRIVYDLVRLGYMVPAGRGQGGYRYRVAAGKLKEARRIEEEKLVRSHPLVKVHRSARSILARGTPATAEEVAAELGIGERAASRYLRILRLVGAMPKREGVGRNNRAAERRRAAKIRREAEASRGVVRDLPGQGLMPWEEATR